MKNHDEMTKAVFERIHKYEAVKSARHRRTITAVCPVCAAAIVGVGLWYSGILTPSPEFSGENQSYIVSSTTNDEVTLLTTAVPTYVSKATETAVKKTAEATVQTEKNDVISTETDETSAECDESNETETEAPAAEVTAEGKPTVTAKTTAKPVTTVRTTAAKTNPVTTQSIQTESIPSNSGTYALWCIFGSSIEWNGQTYHDSDMPNISTYTQDRYIGKVSDFDGIYGDTYKYRIAPDDSVYTVKETDDVLFIIKADANSPFGAAVIMCSPNWSIEKYEPERLDPNYIDPNYDENMPVYN